MVNLVFKSKPAFTLLETVIAAAITVTLLGAVTGVNHSIQSSVIQEQDTAQMSALADESISQVRFWRDTVVVNHPGSAFTNGANGGEPLTQNNTDTDTSVVGAFYVSPAVTGRCDNNGDPLNNNCPPVQSGGPLILTWCDAGNGGSTCVDGTQLQNITSPFATSSSGHCSGSTCNVQDLLSTTNTPLGAAEIIAIPFKPYSLLSSCMPANTSNNTCRFMVDISNPVNSETSFLNTITTTGWNFYSRTVKITRPGNISTCDSSTTFGFKSDTTIFSPACQALRTNTVIVTVTVMNIHNPGSALSKSVTLINSGI